MFKLVFDPNNTWVNQQIVSVCGKRMEISKAGLLTIEKANNIKKG